MFRAPLPPRDTIDWAVQRRRYQLSIHDFARDFYCLLEGVPYVHGQHLTVLGNHLQALGRREITRLLVNLPPSSSKSSWINCLFPAWQWTWSPTSKFACYSYSSALSKKHHGWCRQLVGSAEYRHFFPEVVIKHGEDTKQSFQLLSGGERIVSTLSGGFTTGGHPDFVLIDDPLSVVDSESSVEREKVKFWYFDQMISRGWLRDVCHCVFHQRTHVEDLAGWIIKDHKKQLAESGKSDWYLLVFAMEYEAKLAMEERGYGADWRTEEGQLLWPEFPGFAEKIAKLKRETPKHAWRCQYQEDPRRRKGVLFDVTKLMTISEENPLPDIADFEQLTRAWDRAATEDGGCFTAGVLIGRIGRKFYILHVVHEQLGWAEVESLIETWVHIDEAKYGVDRLRTYIEREGAGSGKQVAEMTEERFAGHRVHAVFPRGSKDFRAENFANAMDRREVHIVIDEWYSEFVDEFQKYTPGKKSGLKDQVDAASMAYIETVTPSNPKHKHTGLVLASSTNTESSRKAAMGGMGPCRNEQCNRPAFAGKYCCECCEEADGSGEEVDHKLRCNGLYTDWYNRSAV